MREEPEEEVLAAKAIAVMASFVPTMKSLEASAILSLPIHIPRKWATQ
jgi:hypothetical protein